MKSIILALVLFMLVPVLVVAAPAPSSHAIPAKSELAVSGSYVKPKGDDAVWSFDGQLAMPADAGGHFLLGPKVHLDSGDGDAAGVVAEVNFAGTAKSGLYIGGNGLYQMKDVAGQERYSVNADAGLKVALGHGGSGFKVFAERVVAGRGSDDKTITGNIGIFVRF